MSVRKTSIEAYNTLKESGKLSELRFFVYDFMYQNAPMTMAEMRDRLNDTRTTYAPRLTELKQMGLIEVVGQKNCDVSGHKSDVLDVTDRSVPLPLPKKEKVLSKKELVESIRIARRALQSIKEHIEISFRRCELSATWNIANKAINEIERRTK